MAEESKYIQKKKKKEPTLQAGPTAGKAKKKKGIPIIIMMDGSEKQFMLDPGKDLDMMKFSKGGRAGFKMGSKCKLAMKGKGRAYGKNS